ncbi:LOW QUALITY PROTEIN: tumor necrosis factor alpha-induced protein 2 [Phyllostomus discolor]|uniref:Tumor necrosis factor alpha-induced protein 2 n=1 Tax=Phyllostomus discolor TaxID=89673 RepID=A0A6J2L5E7_9CHIR|nr:LOW QUALITY PROTEIN: tumor necrosis factor alpha-induced protein 2 [Phyllostomus discolor]
MSEASSEYLAPPLESEGPPERGEQEALRKKPKGLTNMFSIFTKGRKKKGQPSAAKTEGKPEPEPQRGDLLSTAEELKAALELGRLEAAAPLLALERELAASAAAGSASEEELVRRQSKVEALYVLLRDQVLSLLRRPLEVAPERLRQALAVLAEQEREDRRAEAAGPGPSALATTRPRRWLQLWRRGVAQEAQERLDQPPPADAEGRTEAERAFLHMGRTLNGDLEAVVERLKPLFPAEFGVVAAYAESYHQHFAAQLTAMAQFELLERDTYLLLVWVQNLYPNDIINSPKLAGQLQGVELGSLLPPRQIRLLEATFLSNEVTSAKELMARALSLESQHWAQDVAPQRLDGHCHSELAIDIIQIISQSQAKAESITANLGVQIKPLLWVELAAFLRSYQRAFDEFLERCRQLGNYRATVMANINSCWSLRTFIKQNQQTPQDLLGYLSKLKSHGFDTLLQSLVERLQPLFKNFSHTRWAASEKTMENIVRTVESALPEFSGLRDCFREELMELVHRHLVKEYIVQLSKRRLVLKTAEQQRHLSGQILANADLIQRFCTEHGSLATWLHQALPTLAEILRLQDPNAIKMEVATYATLYPDFSKGHLSAILAIKGNLSSSDVKSIRSILDVSAGAHGPHKSLFSLINAA